ncbi:hypothetical protein [Candidatus Uabimicrobium amorphum]|uniref:Uncharacterized protein n=1 Tax=Uabimicrobium amorphum TaxID=2596890 RepID=A0A5S9II27_UABAM|nr:hypothetical protein [Candidatus Uabimicrobium amorphum]BBM82183.1 hypothetical protein UABAM_00526 [Candidatus Uabimicrobium amorphum]
MNWENVAGNPAHVKRLFVKSGLFIPIAIALPALFFQHEVLWIVGGILAGFSFLLCFFIAFLLGGSIRRFEEVVAHIEDGEYLQKWTYTQNEWRPFAAAELERRQKNYQAVIKWSTIIFVVLYVIAASFLYEEKDFLLLTGIFTGVLVFFVTIVFFAGRYREKLWQKNAIDYVDKDTLMTFIGPGFFIRGKEYQSFNEVGVVLLDVSLEDNNLIFKIEIQGNQRVQHDHYVLVPQGETQRAEEIVEYFTKKRE